MAVRTYMRTDSVHLDGRILTYSIRPGGDRVLSLVHGLQARRQTFRKLITQFDEDWTIIAVDLRGHGDSDWTPGQYSLDEFGSDYVSFHKQVVGDRPSVVYGHSLGGWIAAIAETELRHSMLAVGIEDSALYEPTPEQRMTMADFAVPTFMMKSMNQAQQAADPDLQQRWFEGQAYKERDSQDMLSRLSTPLLLVRADPNAGGLLTSMNAGRALEHVGVPYREVFIPHSPHAVHSRFPEVIAANIKSFVAEHSGTKPRGKR